ncbi:hypothetical protein [Nonomuraea gerenzanensis]|uniref:Uncharacterized protein n=1 Tax=Nonomuraea gerenzanensis TaxID=93944 RepID=A0A1M4DXG0_9ACTN|nr:hypothetical protein [Nonomuraea gerenzanensis]UBU19167.1 hypothetical protein LCN96_00480 [Nonomuraea gerenzanensis]SBO91214.1 hypothetical protein BN4615_P728 [Nonomuraea gerenzanensis]
MAGVAGGAPELSELTLLRECEGGGERVRAVLRSAQGLRPGDAEPAGLGG